VVFAWEEHYARLERSAAALHLRMPWTRDEIWTEVARTVAAHRTATGYGGEEYIRLQVTRGGGAIGLDVGLADGADFVVLVQPCPAMTPAVLQRGLRLSFATDLRRNPPESLNPAWKTGNYLNNILCLREARARGADDVLMLNLRGEITEAATANVAFVRGDEVLTPPLAAGILGGITRDILLGRICPKLGRRVREAAMTPANLPAMSECFLMSTTRDVAPVGAIDAVSFAVGAESVTAQLKDAFLAYARESAQVHPARRV
jgi:branched-chain amino acid aminotransferase